jgi:hypothetical protein
MNVKKKFEVALLRSWCAPVEPPIASLRLALWPMVYSLWFRVPSIAISDQPYATSGARLALIDNLILPYILEII